MNSFACGNLQQTVLILLLLGTALLQMFVAIEDVADQRYLPIVFDSALLMAELFYARTLLDAGRGIAGKSDFASETAFLWLMETGLFLYAAVRYIRIRMQVRNFLPRESIKEGSDNLPDGICYFDEYSTVSMTNKKMISIGMILFGKEIQTIDELHRENIRLAETNRRIKWMLDNMSDIVREKEILSMKVRVHDDIGHSILAAKKALVEHQDITVIRKSAALWEAAVDLLYRANHMPAAEDEWQTVERRAKELGVAIVWNWQTVPVLYLRSSGLQERLCCSDPSDTFSKLLRRNSTPFFECLRKCKAIRKSAYLCDFL